MPFLRFNSHNVIDIISHYFIACQLLMFRARLLTKVADFERRKLTRMINSNTLFDVKIGSKLYTFFGKSWPLNVNMHKLLKFQTNQLHFSMKYEN